MAEKFFNVPEWTYFWNATPSVSKKNITKSLSSTQMEGNKFLFTTPVQIDALDKKFPWLIQNRIDAEYDLTIVYINGTLFPFKLRRDEYVDWRQGIGKDEQMWEYLALPTSLEANIISYMQSLKLKYGRLDFLIKGENFLFLEVNPNGQWAFLDLGDKHGLVSKMVDEVSPLTSKMSLCD